MDKPLCRWCGKAIRKTTSQDDATWRHVEADNGHCEAMRRIITGDPKSLIEPG